jgi:ABC-type lipoprotein export system ATPase subunit
MTRGNQREKARAKNLKQQKEQNKHKTTMSGSQFQRAKEDAAAIMREKQRLADERRAAEAAKKK